jgi:two-component system phosphate regulon sensor histidine kinase PhoR
MEETPAGEDASGGAGDLTTTAKQLNAASVLLASLGAGGAVYAAGLALLGRPISSANLQYVLLGLVTVFTATVLFLYRRSIRRSAATVSDQLETMTQTGQLGLVMAEGPAELSWVAKPLNELLSQLKKQTDQLRGENRELQIQFRVAAAEKHHTEAIILSITDGVIVTNRFDELILANEAAEGMLGFKLSASLRKNIDRVVSDGTLVRLIRETRAHGHNLVRKVVEHSMDQKGSPRTFSITLSCVTGVGDEVSGVVAVLHDVTREKEIARMKTDFVSNVSHELKTPLSSIKAYIEMLQDGEARDEKCRREFYEIIATETNRLHRLIENILNISRIESGVVKVVKEPISLTGVVKQVLDVAAPQAKAKNIRVVENLQPVYSQVEADRDMIYQAVMNLVSNALKYTRDGGMVTVRVTTDEQRKVAVCEVTDTGLGIPTEDLPRIFDKFYRVQANSKIAKGTGLGLTLVKHIIETVHEGRIAVTSEVGKGSTFSFELPLIH